MFDQTKMFKIRKANPKALIKNPSFVCKVIEAVLCLIGVSLLEMDGTGITMVYELPKCVILGTYGFSMITLTFIVAYAISETHKLLETLLIFAGCVLNLSGGFAQLTADIYTGFSNVNNVTITCIMCGSVMFIDVLLQVSDLKCSLNLLKQYRRVLLVCFLLVVTAIKVAVPESYYDVPKKIMSSEVENKDEEKQDEPKTPLHRKILVHWQIGFKVVELILAAVCMGFIYEPVQTTGMGKSHLHHVGVMYTAYMGSVVIILSLLVGRLLKDTIGYRTSFVFSTANATLYLATGILFTADKADLTKDHFYHPSWYLLNMLTTAIVTTFLNGIVFIADAVLTFKRQQNF